MFLCEGRELIFIYCTILYFINCIYTKVTFFSEIEGVYGYKF